MKILPVLNAVGKVKDQNSIQKMYPKNIGFLILNVQNAVNILVQGRPRYAMRMIFPRKIIQKIVPMEVFRDDFGRRIWFYVNPTQIDIELQDLNEDFEYERSAKVTSVSAVCRALHCQFSDLKEILVKKFGGKVNSFDLFTEFLSENNINYDYYSGGR